MPESMLVLGGGRLGATLMRDLARQGVAVSAVVRSPLRRAQLDQWLRDQSLSVPLHPALPSGALGWVLAAVPDREIANAGSELHSMCDRPPVVALHLSGVAPARELRAKAALGGALGSLHPLAAVPDPVQRPVEPSPLVGALMGVGGDPAAIAAAQVVAGLLGGQTVVLGDAQRPGWHAAAALIANDWVALALVAEAAAAQAGLAGPEVRAGLLHLARTALEALRRVGPEDPWVAGLTGAVARGDAETLARHARVLRGAPAAATLHQQASEVLIQACQEAGRMDPDVAAGLRGAMREPDSQK